MYLSCYISDTAGTAVGVQVTTASAAVGLSGLSVAGTGLTFKIVFATLGAHSAEGFTVMYELVTPGTYMSISYTCLILRVINIYVYISNIYIESRSGPIPNLSLFLLGYLGRLHTYIHIMLLKSLATNNAHANMEYMERFGTNLKIKGEAEWSTCLHPLEPKPIYVQ
jgi:hypothetical protein